VAFSSPPSPHIFDILSDWRNAERKRKKSFCLPSEWSD
jgi:hypothetical protein